MNLTQLLVRLDPVGLWNTFMDGVLGRTALGRNEQRLEDMERYLHLRVSQRKELFDLMADMEDKYQNNPAISALTLTTMKLLELLSKEISTLSFNTIAQRALVTYLQIAKTGDFKITDDLATEINEAFDLVEKQVAEEQGAL